MLPIYFIIVFVVCSPFPIEYYRYYLSKSYGISTQAFPSWMRDGVIKSLIKEADAKAFVNILQTTEVIGMFDRGSK
ncbi:hypothetical protein LSPH24S_00089 [Lysinibacillus sphaericus]